MIPKVRTLLRSWVKKLYMYYTVRRSGLFDREYYLKNNLDVARDCHDPIWHYIRHGWKEGRNPSKSFNTNSYLKLHPDLRKSGVNPLYYYIKFEAAYLPSTTITPAFLSLELFTPRPAVSLAGRYKDKCVTIILPVYNAHDYIERLLSSVFQNSDLDFKLIAINDCSTEKSITPLLQKYAGNYDNFIFLQNAENLGFVKTVNRGIKEAKSGDILIVNSDVEVPQNWLSRIFHPIWSAEKVASVTPMSNSATLMSFPEFGHNELFEGLSLQQIDEEFQKLNPDKDIYIPSPTGHGFCMAMSRKAIDEIGLFNEELFGKGYGEENDWCMRALSKGFKNVIATNVFVYHKHTVSFDDKTRSENIRNSSRIIAQKYPDYSARTRAVKLDPKYNSIREFLSILVFAKTAGKTVLRLEHAFGGGSAFACEDYIKENKDNTLILVLRPGNNKGPCTLSCCFKNYQKTFRLKCEQDIYDIFEYIRINEIIINQLVGYPAIAELLDLIKKIKNTFKPVITINIRDFYPICPEYTLMYLGREFCGAQQAFDCCTCYKKMTLAEALKSKFPTIRAWRDMWSSFLIETDQIRVFSEFTKSMVIKCFPQISSKIQKSSIPIGYLRKTNISIHADSVNIAVLGNINYCKGAGILSEMLCLIKKQHNNTQIHLFGKTNDARLRDICKGTYTRNELPHLMEQNKIDIIFIPSIWGETFCRTVEEAIEMDMPVAVFNIGAPPERVAEYKKGIVIDRIDAKHALEKMLQFVINVRKNNAA